MIFDRGLKRNKAVGLLTKELINEGVETVVICEGSFAAYNYVLSYEEVKGVVESLDYQEEMKNLWETKK